MPIVLVHGVPDTHRLWDKMRAHLSRKDVLVPDLPGLGVETPAADLESMDCDWAKVTDPPAMALKRWTRPQKRFREIIKHQ